MDTVAKTTKRRYHVFDYYGAKDAERVLIIMGSGAQTAEETTDTLNESGKKVGLVKVRLYRPFDGKRFCQALLKPASKLPFSTARRKTGS